MMKDFPHFCTIDDLNITDYDKSKTLVSAALKSKEITAD